MWIAFAPATIFPFVVEAAVAVVPLVVVGNGVGVVVAVIGGAVATSAAEFPFLPHACLAPHPANAATTSEQAATVKRTSARNAGGDRREEGCAPVSSM